MLQLHAYIYGEKNRERRREAWTKGVAGSTGTQVACLTNRSEQHQGHLPKYQGLLTSSPLYRKYV